MSSTPSPPETESKSIQKTTGSRLRKLPVVLFNRHWWWSTLIVILAILVLARLGVWQLDRLQQRRALNAAFIAQFYGEKLDLNGELSESNPEDLTDRQAVVSGQFDYSNQIILNTQNYGGRPGVHLVTPLLIDGKDEAVLVDRGWIPSDEFEKGELERFDETAEQPVEGVLQLSQTLNGNRETAAEPGQKEWYRIDIEAIKSVFPYKLLPVYMLESPEEEVDTTLPIRQEIELDLTDGPHLGYAIQWFLFAIILVIGYVRYVWLHDEGPES
ncbi:MAG: SURF1 family protein [Candidatus Promineifilaceae bacterium]